MTTLAPAAVLLAAAPSPTTDAPPPARVEPIASTSTAPTTSQPSSTVQPSTAPAAPSAAGCRLLWRGRLLLSDKGDKPLFGVAIIAHLFSVPSISLSATAKQAAAPVSPFDDPFASSASSDAAADLCLGLEMMRGGDLKVLGEILVDHSGSAQREGPPSSAERAKKGKGKDKAREQKVEVETPTDVRVYVDPRCPETRAWMEDHFCRAGCEGRGLRIDMGGEEVVIFGSAPPLPTPSAASSSSGPPARPPITLMLGRAIKRPVRAPRPDDPMPRESLFATKLRRTSSTPSLSFPPPAPKLSRAGSSLGSISESLSTSSTVSAHTQAQRKLKRGSSSRTLMSLMGDEAARKSLTGRQSSLPPAPAPYDEPTAAKKPRRTLSRSSSSRSLLSGSSTFLAAAPAPPARSGLKRSRSTRVLASPVTSEDEEERRRGHSRAPGSPTPSIGGASEWGGDEDELGDEPRDLAARGGGGALGKREKMKRSTSAPAGVFEAKMMGRGPLRDAMMDSQSQQQAQGRSQRGTSLAPPATSRGQREKSVVREQSVEPSFRDGREQSLAPGPRGAREESVAPPPDSVECRNKGTIRKLVLSALLAHSIPREHPQFRDVFSMCSKGVQFALRLHWKTRPVDKEQATELVVKHVGMYVLPAEPSDSATIEVDPRSRPIADEQGRMPTPAATPAPQLSAAESTEKRAEVEVQIKAEVGSTDFQMQSEGPQPALLQSKDPQKDEGSHLPSPKSLEVAGEESAEDHQHRRRSLVA